MHVRMLETMAKCFSGGPCSDTRFHIPCLPASFGNEGSWVDQHGVSGVSLNTLHIEDTDEPLGVQQFVFVYTLACRLLFFSFLIWKAHNIVNCFRASFFLFKKSCWTLGLLILRAT